MAFDNSPTVLISVQNTSPKRKRVNTEHGLAHENLALSAWRFMPFRWRHELHLSRLFTRLRFGLVLKYRRRLSVIQRHFDPELRGYIRWLSPIR